MNVVTKPPRTIDNFFSFNELFHKNSHAVLVNIRRHIFVKKYSLCGPIHFKQGI